MTDPDRTVESFCDKVDKPINIIGLNVQQRMALRQRR